MFNIFKSGGGSKVIETINTLSSFITIGSFWVIKLELKNILGNKIIITNIILFNYSNMNMRTSLIFVLLEILKSAICY